MTAASVIIGVALLGLAGTALASPVRRDDVGIPTRDDRELQADLVLPEGDARRPAIVVMTPYNRKLLPALLADRDMGFGPDYAREYAWVLVDWRGFFGSKPAGRLLGGKGLEQHGKDGYDVVEWVAGQPWSNGKVGMWGGSALGRVQYHTALEHPPHLVCGVPMAAPYGYRYGQFYAGGVLRKAYLETLGVAYGSLRRVRDHPTEDALWKEIEARVEPQRIDVPMLIVTGWFDLFTQDVIDTFRELKRRGGPQARRGTQLLVGPWSHTEVGAERQGDLRFPAAAGEPGRAAMAFFDHWLRGAPAADAPAVRYFQMGADAWRTAADWPPADGAPRRLHLRADGALTPEPPAADEAARSFSYDPDDPSPTIGGANAFIKKNPEYTTVGAGPRDQRAVTRRRDHLGYRTAELKEPIEVDGAPSVHVFFASDREDTDVAVRLVDVYPDGREMLVTDGIQRARFRAGTDAEQLLTPGRVVDMTVQLAVTAYTFLPGHRVQLIVTSSNAPRFEPNANIDRKRLFGPRSRTATNTLNQDAAHPSVLVLPSAGSSR